MPGGDKTGPEGLGPLTGRGLGPCGRGLGFRRGFGRGYGYRKWRRPIYTNYPLTEQVELSKDEQKRIIESEIKDFEQELKTLKDELKKLE